MNKEIKFGYWGRYKEFSEDEEPRMIWIGPMTHDEMIEHFNEFRHNFNPDTQRCPETPRKRPSQRDR